MKISIVIPCYGSENTIEKVVGEIIDTVNNHGDQYEIILVNDYSPDLVWEKVLNLCENDSNIRGIHLAKNSGQHAALMAGYSYCTGEVVVSVDDDGQIPVNEMYLLIQKIIQDNLDVVYGTYENKKHNSFRNWGSRVNAFMTEVLINKPKSIQVTSFFAARKYIIDEIVKYKNPYPYVIGLVLRTTKKIGNISVNHRERQDGKSGYTIKKLLSLWMNGFTAFSVKPLRIATFLGFGVAIAGFTYGLVLIIRKLLGLTVVLGYSSLMATMLFIGGLIMIILGLIGEYIGRIYISINNSPQYVIRETINLGEKEFV